MPQATLTDITTHFNNYIDKRVRVRVLFNDFSSGPGGFLQLKCPNAWQHMVDLGLNNSAICNTCGPLPMPSPRYAIRADCIAAESGAPVLDPRRVLLSSIAAASILGVLADDMFKRVQYDDHALQDALQAILDSNCTYICLAACKADGTIVLMDAACQDTPPAHPRKRRAVTKLQHSRAPAQATDRLACLAPTTPNPRVAADVNDATKQ